MRNIRSWNLTWPGWMMAPLALLLLLLIACGTAAEPVVVEREVIKEVPKEVVVEKEVVKEVPKEVVVEKVVVKEVVKEVLVTPVAEPVSAVLPGVVAKYGGIVRERATDWPPSYDVNNETSYQHVIYNAKFYNNLLWNPGGTEIECDICTSWQSQDDGKTLAFDLIEGIKFQDGKDLTSKDVAFSFNKMMGNIEGFGVSPRVGLMKEYIDAVETPDPHSVIFRLKRPAPALPAVLVTGFTGIMPEGTTRDMLKDKPRGSGPFMLDEAVRGSFMLMEKNPAYFKKGLPYLDGIKVFQIKGDPETQAAMVANEIDWTQLTLVENTWEPRFAKLESEGKIVRFPYSNGCRPQGIMMNMNKPPFDNLKVRQAVNLALDRKSYMEVQHEGKAVPLLVFPVDGSSGRAKVEFWDKYPGWGTGADKAKEIEQAKKLMAEAGYPDGFDVVLDVRNTTGYMRQGEWAAAQLAKIGIRTKQNVGDSATLFPKWQAHDFQVFAYWFCQTTGDPDEMWAGYFLTGGSRNWLGYSNKEIDDLHVVQSSERDPAKRAEINRRMEDIILADMPFAPLGEHQSEQIWWSYLKGYRFGLTFYATGATRHEQIWIDK